MILVNFSDEKARKLVTSYFNREALDNGKRASQNFCNYFLNQSKSLKYIH